MKPETKTAGQILAESLQSGTPLNHQEFEAALQRQCDELNASLPKHLRAPVQVTVEINQQREARPEFIIFTTSSNNASASYITCLICNRTSYHPDDIKNRYCGNCHRFLDDHPQRNTQ
ncbi:MAG TPA: hypothetical protein VGB45_06075 [Abditibacterium sp.]